MRHLQQYLQEYKLQHVEHGDKIFRDLCSSLRYCREYKDYIITRHFCGTLKQKQINFEIFVNSTNLWQLQWQCHMFVKLYRTSYSISCVFYIVSHHMTSVISSNWCQYCQSSSNSETGMEAEGYPYYFEKLTGEEETTVRAHFLTNSTSRDLGRYFPNSQL